ncbi:MAG TPA: ribosomal-processing cysteine protease Prp [Clostridia bacterium]|nr:ribosomal-processing cysteine protease Prp [Clostridia bacterium]
MTEATFFRCGGRMAGFEAQGHADSAEEGEDIVCAGISALTQAALIGIREYLGIDCAWEIADGYLYCMLPSDIGEKEWREAEIILETMALGLGSLAETYGTFLKLIEREV